MRQVGSFERQDYAATFTDYLVAQGIAAICEASGDTWSIWVRDEDRVQESREAYRQFQQNPTAKEYRQVASAADRVRAEQIARRQQAAAHTIDVRQQIFERTLIQRAPVTMVLVGLSLLVALATRFGQDQQSVFYHSLTFADVRHALPQGLPRNTSGLQDIRRGELWRLITPIFLHFNLFHLVFNMWWLITLGSQIEARKGALWLGGIVLASAIAGNLGQFILGGSPWFGGMSGVVYGLFGFLWLRMRIAPADGLGVQQGTTFIMVLVLVLGFLGALDDAVGSGSIANWAHLFGLLAGLATALAVPPLSSQANRNPGR